MAHTHKRHQYLVQVEWTGDRGTGTSAYGAYARDHVLLTVGKPPILASSDVAFRGDPARYNPEELLVAALASCHMLWYLHLCAEAGITVVGYSDGASGTMEETANGGGRFTGVELRPVVAVDGNADHALALRLHERAHQLCYISASVNFPVTCQPAIRDGSGAGGI
jgi:organic hydroperoxide reductase OsmC/OhrA